MHVRTKRFLPLLGVSCLAFGLLAPVNAAQNSAEIEVFTTGSGTKKALRYAPEAGSKAGFSMETKMSMTQQMNGMQMPAQDMPSMITDYALTVDEIRESGEIVTSVETVDARLGEGGNPMVRGSVEQAIRAGVGGKTRAIQKPTGEVVSSERLGGDGVAMPGGVDQMSIRFPEEAMGVGGRWVERRNMEQGGVRFSQHTTYEVKAIEGNVVTLGMEVKVEAPRQGMENPQLPPGSMELVKMNGNGTGTIKMDLAKMIAIESKMEMSTDQEVKITMNGGEQTMSQTMSMEMTMKERDLD